MGTTSDPSAQNTCALRPGYADTNAAGATATGCAANWYHNAEVCTACPSGWERAGADFWATDAACTRKAGYAGTDATADATGCEAQYYEPADALTTCVACRTHSTHSAAAFHAAGTTCAVESGQNSCQDSTAGKCDTDSSATGCAADYYQSTAGAAADAGCTACPNGYAIAEAAFNTAATTACTLQGGYTGGDGTAIGATGCSSDYTTGGTSDATLACTACTGKPGTATYDASQTVADAAMCTWSCPDDQFNDSTTCTA
jgi:hypothetical protein